MAKRRTSSAKHLDPATPPRPQAKRRSPHQGGKTAAAPPAGEKVGSSEQAAEHFGGRDDFGIPAQQAQPHQQTVIDGNIEDRPLGTRLPPADPDGVRTVGVGAPDSGPGSGSGGDLDPDILGVGTGSGVAARPGSLRTEGPDIIESTHDDKVFGPPSKGENELPPGTHGVTGKIEGTVHDRMDRQDRPAERTADQGSAGSD
jgi:hypothetical protein